jgi:ketosteroid isomerase-like protein
VTEDKPKPFDPESDTRGEQSATSETKSDTQIDAGIDANDVLENFLQKLPANFRWPKPDAASVAAAEEAVQRVASGPAAGDKDKDKNLVDVDDADDTESICAACGGLLPTVARFCVWCGIPTRRAGGDLAGQDARQRHVHHHFHHIMPAQATAAPAEQPVAAPAVRPPTSPGGRAEAAARQVVQNWVQACNIKHIDDMLELYSADATLIRSNVPPVRSLPAIRTFLVSLLEAGLGDVEMESLRFEMLGDMALDIGRCKMLVPVAMGKRREERGKYLIVMTRKSGNEWKILADSWASDLPLNTQTPEAAKKPSEAARPGPPAPKPR